MRPSIIEVDLNILKNNLRLIRQHIDDRPVMAVVKSNAYGHGLVRVANLYEQLGVNSLGVALPEEGIILRKSGISLPIAVFGALLKEQIPGLLEWDLELPRIAHAWNIVAHATHGFSPFEIEHGNDKYAE